MATSTRKITRALETLIEAVTSAHATADDIAGTALVALSTSELYPWREDDVRRAERRTHAEQTRHEANCWADALAHLADALATLHCIPGNAPQAPQTPKYRHTCPNCTFLGNLDFNDRHYDLYVHHSCTGTVHYLARWSSRVDAFTFSPPEPETPPIVHARELHLSRQETSS